MSAALEVGQVMVYMLFALLILVALLLAVTDRWVDAFVVLAVTAFSMTLFAKLGVIS